MAPDTAPSAGQDRIPDTAARRHRCRACYPDLKESLWAAFFAVLLMLAAAYGLAMWLL